MAESRVGIPFEGKEIFLDLPPTWRILGEIRPASMPGLPDLAGALGKELAAPIGCPPLGPGDLKGKKICIAVDDITRPTPLHRYFGEVIRWLEENGASKEDMLILTALGIHVKMTQKEIEKKLGVEAIAGIRWINHDCKAMRELVDLGKTRRGTEVILNRHLLESDIILCVGAAEPHPLLGFGGGLKMILPGLAHERTIAQNHMQGVSPEKFNYIGAIESPMRLDIEEAAGMLGKRIFIINAVMNDRLEIARFVCGDPVAAQREGARLAGSISGKPIGELADVAIVASNPMNADLRQGMKSIANVEQSVKEGGLILAFLECSRGIGDVAVPPRTLPHGLLRLILKAVGRKRILGFVDRVKRDAGVEERFLAHFSMQVVRKNEIFVFSSRLPPDTGKRMGLFRQFGRVDRMMERAVDAAPRWATVYVYPHGGVTYPVLGH